MTDSVFRTASEPEVNTPRTEGSGEVSKVEVNVPDLLVSYEEDQGKPYVAQYFDVAGTWNREPSLERDVREIDGYLKEQVKKGELDNSTRAATKFIKEMERAAGLTGYESVSNRITKLLAYIDFKRVVNG